MAIGEKINPITQKKTLVVVMPSEQGQRMSDGDAKKIEEDQRRTVEIKNSQASLSNSN